jgi:hypothetical protein
MIPRIVAGMVRMGHHCRIPLPFILAKSAKAPLITQHEILGFGVPNQISKDDESSSSNVFKPT